MHCSRGQCITAWYIAVHYSPLNWEDSSWNWGQISAVQGGALHCFSSVQYKRRTKTQLSAMPSSGVQYNEQCSAVHCSAAVGHVTALLLMTLHCINLPAAGHNALHIAQCTVHTANCTQNFAHCKLYTAHCTLHTAHWTLDTETCTLHIAYYTLNTAHSVVCF